MSISGIHGQLLEVTVVGCNKLKDTEWISRQDPYVCLEYASTKFRTRTHTDGGKNPTFQEKFVFTLIEGLRELNVAVWNSNTLSFDDFIGSGKIQLHKALSHGYDDSAWPLQSKTGRHAGEVRLIIHFANNNKPNGGYHASAPLAPTYTPTHAPQLPLYTTPPPSSQYPPQPFSGYAPPSPYPPSYPHSAYGPSRPDHNYPPPPFPPQSAYPPPAYPPPPNAPNFPPTAYPPGPYPGMYPPPPY